MGAYGRPLRCGAAQFWGPSALLVTPLRSGPVAGL